MLRVFGRMIVYFVSPKIIIKKKLSTITASFDDNYDPQSLFDNKHYFYDFASCASELTAKTSW